MQCKSALLPRASQYFSSRQPRAQDRACPFRPRVTRVSQNTPKLSEATGLYPKLSRPAPGKKKRRLPGFSLPSPGVAKQQDGFLSRAARPWAPPSAGTPLPPARSGPPPPLGLPCKHSLHLEPEPARRASCPSRRPGDASEHAPRAGRRPAVRIRVIPGIAGVSARRTRSGL
ncbi:unnamed protein product [Rangifer tarandus platyrhynchus]|uniref:Uncharacterized protein n=2 Tax=Rangifer tarandus platyrhynchus TaxID=3082113 RepID=A0ABN8YFR1_RANTA|nr:unnamed protein product [Rangifer tarandus platyrhynchus]CAI9700182.1 unnamed protein product [Rangifer tarandus platyrhynchus]